MSAEIKRYWGDKNLTINDCSSKKNRKLDIEERKVEWSYPDISTIMNECPLYDIVHVCGLLFNKSEEKSKLNNGQMLRIVKAKMKVSNRTSKIYFSCWFHSQSEGRQGIQWGTLE